MFHKENIFYWIFRHGCFFRYKNTIFRLSLYESRVFIRVEKLLQFIEFSDKNIVVIAVIAFKQNFQLERRNVKIKILLDLERNYSPDLARFRFNKR